MFREQFGAPAPLDALRAVLRIRDAVENGVHPGRKTCSLLRVILIRVEICLGEGVLYRLFGILGALEYRPRPPQECGLVAADEKGEKVGLLLGARQNLRVRERVESGS